MKQPKVVAIAGLIGSGKNTVGGFLQKYYNYSFESFARPLKEATASIFGWDYEMLLGETTESRIWREQVDVYWSEKLNIPHLTPRWVLQHLGTNVIRNNFNEGIWIYSLEHRLLKNENPVIVTDARFWNELDLVKNVNGCTICVIKEKPVWWDIAVDANLNNNLEAIEYLNKEVKIHPSEYSWVGYDFNYVVYNTGTLEELEQKVAEITEDWC